ncbi:MAG: hypothetical protein A2X56_10315 [Nitrospirae bacterium GWC2_57_13]|nr:MAG: hypothetical protein A2072_08285 [Nitrospirae bacterium GWC1_57_7]OGW26762.1 MAG: hypothetical protein A2X56_10315 [Nitrospirae bacterium GWC2_57_13]OGW43690.1 MAG: hypothetical protein A2X57_12370 [Nitrospirae bacterium GWD2_57_8]
MFSRVSITVACCATLLFCMLALFPRQAAATPEFALQSGQACSHCHVSPGGGRELTAAGSKFLPALQHSGGHTTPVTKTLLRIIMGYFHLLASIVWFGTILYVHVLLKPAYASKGLPKGELRLGWLSMIVVLLTGTYLTFWKVPSWDLFFSTRYGALLGIKILLFLVMFSSAIIVTIYIGPRLRKRGGPAALNIAGGITPEQLPHFDGKDGRPAYIAYQGRIYDVTGSRLWKNGSHMMKHAAGHDLTSLLSTAPHGEDKVKAMTVVSKRLSTGEQPHRPFHVRLFYFFAYMNLTLVFVITFVIALWRWW